MADIEVRLCTLQFSMMCSRNGVKFVVKFVKTNTIGSTGE